MVWTSSASVAAAAAAAAAAQVAIRMETMRKAEAGLINLSRRFEFDGNNNNNNNNNDTTTTNQHDDAAGKKEEEEENKSYTLELFDTEIPVSILPFQCNDQNSSSSSSSYWNYWNVFSTSSSSNSEKDNEEVEEEEQLTMHAIRVTKEKEDTASGTLPQSTPRYHNKYPLVIVHGYMNGALYFYRNIIGLANFFDTVISVDLLGWGLSSRPSFARLRDDSVATTEDFFVESLEYWRASNEIEKMILAGHSLGGYLSVAYCEKYPERVDRLLLLSPAGVPDDAPSKIEHRRAQFLTSYSRKAVYEFFGKLWDYGYTPGSVMRTIPESRGRALVEGYVRNRLPSIRDDKERSILTDYMYTGSILPGSGEYALNRLLLPGALAKQPCLHRIPQLQISNISFLYGLHDWMDVNGGLDVQHICNNKREQQQQQQQSCSTITMTTTDTVPSNDDDDEHTTTRIVPTIDVYQVPDAGHLLMLENSIGFNTAVIHACSTCKDGDVSHNHHHRPIVATRKKNDDQQPSSIEEEGQQ